MGYTEPIHDLNVRTTAVSTAEGRTKLDVGKKKKRKIIKKMLSRY